MKVLAEARPRRIAMKRGRLAGLAIGLGVISAAGCGRAAERPVAERAERNAGSPSPYATNIGEIQVDYRSVSIPDHMAPGGGVYFQFQVRNTGTKIWPVSGANPVRFGSHWEVPRGEGKWERIVWDDGSRGWLKTDMKPGETALIVLPVHAPQKNCPDCKLVVAPLLEMKGWSESSVFVAPVNVS